MNLLVITDGWYKLHIPAGSYHSTVVIKGLPPPEGTTERWGSRNHYCQITKQTDTNCTIINIGSNCNDAVIMAFRQMVQNDDLDADGSISKRGDDHDLCTEGSYSKADVIMTSVQTAHTTLQR